MCVCSSHLFWRQLPHRPCVSCSGGSSSKQQSSSSSSVAMIFTSRTIHIRESNLRPLRELRARVRPIYSGDSVHYTRSVCICTFGVSAGARSERLWSQLKRASQTKIGKLINVGSRRGQEQLCLPAAMCSGTHSFHRHAAREEKNNETTYTSVACPPAGPQNFQRPHASPERYRKPGDVHLHLDNVPGRPRHGANDSRRPRGQ